MIFDGGQFFGGEAVPESCAGAFPEAGSACAAVAGLVAGGTELAGAGAESQLGTTTFFLWIGFFAGGCDAVGLAGDEEGADCLVSVAGACGGAAAWSCGEGAFVAGAD